MKHLKKAWWMLPTKIRKPIVSLVGFLFIVASALTGWLPGPGGIPLLIIGIAILATEFEWAQVIKDRIFEILHELGHWLRHHKKSGINIVIILFSLLTILLVLNLPKS